MKDNNKGLTLEEIKQAINDGKKVYWSNLAHEVIKDNKGQYLIKHSIGSTWADNTTLNVAEKDFFIQD